jgi:hypothetical protein
MLAKERVRLEKAIYDYKSRVLKKKENILIVWK